MKQCLSSRYFLLFFVFAFMLLSAGKCSATQFPNDAKEITLDVHSGTSGTLLASSTSERTILYSAIDTTATDGHICIGSTCSANPAILKFEDTEFSGNGHVEKLHSYFLPAGTDITWSKAGASDKQFMSLVYVDYNLASSTASSTGQTIINNYYGETSTTTLASSTAPMDISNIEQIGFVATSTQIAGGVQVWQGVFSIPFWLLCFVAIIILIILYIVFSMFSFRKNK